MTDMGSTNRQTPTVCGNNVGGTTRGEDQSHGEKQSSEWWEMDRVAERMS